MIALAEKITTFQVFAAAALVGVVLFGMSQAYYVWAVRRGKAEEARGTRPAWLQALFALIFVTGLAGLTWAVRSSKLFERDASVEGNDLLVVAAEPGRRVEFLTLAPEVEQGDKLVTYRSVRHEERVADVRSNLEQLQDQLADARTEPVQLEHTIVSNLEALERRRRVLKGEAATLLRERDQLDRERDDQLKTLRRELLAERAILAKHGGRLKVVRAQIQFLEGTLAEELARGLSTRHELERRRIDELMPLEGEADSLGST
ncbi:MAG: hypothetical protein ACYS22_18855, partial [Planctomycetota bacterium]